MPCTAPPPPPPHIPWKIVAFVLPLRPQTRVLGPPLPAVLLKPVTASLLAPPHPFEFPFRFLVQGILSHPTIKAVAPCADTDLTRYPLDSCPLVLCCLNTCAHYPLHPS